MFSRVIARTALVAGALALAAGGARAVDPAPGGAPAVAGVSPGVVDGATARKLVAAGVKVVDVRTPSEFSGGHVPGALNIPHGEVAGRHAEIGPPSTPVLLYCASGRRTKVAEQALRERGFSIIYDMQSYARWVEAEPK